MNFKEAYKIYIEYQKATIKKSSLITIKERFKNYILPFFSVKELPIETSDLINFKNYLNDLKISQSYKRSLMIDLSCMLNFLFRTYDYKNNMNRIKNFKRPRKQERPILTNQEYLRLRKEFKKLDQLFFDVLFYGGLRRGEALALTKQSINNNGVNICLSYSKNEITTPKTDTSYRLVTLPEKIIKQLKEQANKCRERIFEDLSYTTIKRRFDKALKIINHTPMRIHDIRHSHITNLLREGFTPQAIAKRVGHSDIETLLNVYAETINEDDIIISKYLENEIKKGLENKPF